VTDTIQSSLGHPMMLPDASEGAVISRYFKGTPQATATDAAEFLAHITPLGWTETGRTYTTGSWGCGPFLVALLLAIVLIGIIVFLYLLIVKPAGTLVVTYSRAETPKTPPGP
jgi:hypothetical protein